MHEIATKLYEPNSFDQGQGIDNIFGATTMIINGGLECSDGNESDGALDRANYYANLMNYFNMPTELGTGCGTMKPFTEDSAGNYSSSFDARSTQGACEVVSYVSQYSYFRNDDYKRCVCDAWAPGDADCLNGNSDPIKTQILQ